MANRLQSAKSLYLRQHADNPVDWYEWGDIALARAKAENKPIFLSVGYSSCHWCHVMAHESFEDQAVADVLNAHFVSIKLDREERPDLDEVFITAVQLATGHAGWPMTLFLTPELEPFFAGTYFPRDSRGQVPGFLTLASNVASAWREQTAAVRKSAAEFVGHLNSVLAKPIPSANLRVELIDKAVEALHETFDFENGGFGDRPKFPPYSALRFLIEYLTIRPELPGQPDDKRRFLHECQTMIQVTLENMIGGGIHDWVGGGLHRYSTDERWFLPHFEKVTADNAQLIWVLAMADRTGFTGLKTSCDDAIAWLKEVMQNPDGTFGSAVDADADGEEGTFTTWEYQELVDLIGEEAAIALGAKPEGNCEDEATGAPTGRNLLLPPADGTRRSERDILRNVRAKRVQPDVDTKAVAAINGLVISALAAAGDTATAKACADEWIRRSTGGLPHMVQDGVVSGVAFLEDVAYMTDGLIDLADATGEDSYREAANEILLSNMPAFGDHDRAGFFFSGPDPHFVYQRSKPILDAATPGANAVVIRVLRRLEMWDEASRTLAAFLGWAERIPTATETLLSEAMHFLALGRSVNSDSDSRQVTAKLEPTVLVAGHDGWAYANLVVDIPAGCHINSQSPAADWMIPTTLEATGAYAEASFPDGDADQYVDELIVPVRMQAKSPAVSHFTLSLIYQLCTANECYAPRTLDIPGQISVQPTPPDVNSHA